MTTLGIALLCLFSGFVTGAFVTALLVAASRKTPEVTQ